MVEFHNGALYFYDVRLYILFALALGLFFYFVLAQFLLLKFAEPWLIRRQELTPIKVNRLSPIFTTLGLITALAYVLITAFGLLTNQIVAILTGCTFWYGVQILFRNNQAQFGDPHSTLQDVMYHSFKVSVNMRTGSSGNPSVGPTKEKLGASGKHPRTHPRTHPRSSTPRSVNLSKSEMIPTISKGGKRTKFLGGAVAIEFGILIYWIVLTCLFHLCTMLVS